MTATSNATIQRCSYCGVQRSSLHHAFCLSIIDGALPKWVEDANDKSEANTPKKETDIPMASYTTRQRTTIRHEYIIMSPANWVEVQKAFRAARSDMQAAGLNHHRIEADDSVWVDKHGEDVVVFWDEEKNDDA